ncbi:LysR substrate-binding domain-containing protein [Herbaspirillum sp. RTI4]|uniref:LysR substrate-binding domain-containing protein n=1 Tax=Herbaspirillum sp. RTI4 TaxID=3048640 RepID=UPI002AB5AFF3|nr:LysR substrate-binding domain-containing protein [Herbaspirillum sp. RTI4]MDY7579850.1 LysR substrate-binding domain-containing protein [Herbaspirillum sp. RTI4]MEA9981937.1 LysR substrate-binding domain-containing protein [Herbaspirillum sp. RTI4]
MNNPPLLEDLRLFCLVARKNSFIASAKEVGASPAFVSKRIAVLEQALGVRLFHRTTRSVVMTDDGSNVHEWARKILDDVEHMVETAASAKQVPRGLLKIGTSFALGRKYISPLLSVFAREHPALKIELELLDREVDMVNEGFDLDIRVGVAQEPHLFAQRLVASQRALFASPDYLRAHPPPVRLGDLAQHQCLVIRERNQSFGIWRMVGPAGPETVKVTGALASNHGEIIHQWAVDGHGIILRSIWDVADSVTSGQLTRVLPAYFQEADLCAVYPLQLKNSAKIRECVQFLQRELKL